MCVCVVWIRSVQPGMFSNRGSEIRVHAQVCQVWKYMRKSWLCTGLDGFGCSRDHMEGSRHRNVFSSVLHLCLQCKVVSWSCALRQLLLMLALNRRVFLEPMTRLDSGSSGSLKKLKAGRAGFHFGLFIGPCIKNKKARLLRCIPFCFCMKSDRNKQKKTYLNDCL